MISPFHFYITACMEDCDKGPRNSKQQKRSFFRFKHERIFFLLPLVALDFTLMNKNLIQSFKKSHTAIYESQVQIGACELVLRMQAIFLDNIFQKWKLPLISFSSVFKFIVCRLQLVVYIQLSIDFSIASCMKQYLQTQHVRKKPQQTYLNFLIE